jgi:tRNA modification GTPase
VATVLVAGPRAVEIVRSLFSLARPAADWPQPWGNIRLGHWGGPAGEEVVVTAIGPARVEIHCHGGRAAPEAVLASLAAQGCVVREWADWLVTAGNAPIQAAAAVALAAARTERTATILLDQYQGALGRACAEIDSFIARGEAQAARRGVDALLTRAPLGRHLTEPWKVVLAGPPNAGKSSLINALVGYERAIVSDLPGTTRDLVSAPAALAGWPVDLVDTAGLRASDDPLEAAGVALAEAQLATADAIVLVFDLQSTDDALARRLITAQPDAIVVRSKCDLAKFDPASVPAAIFTSVVTRHGLAALEQAIAERLVPDEPPPGCGVPFAPAQVRGLQQVAAALEAADLSAARTHLARIAE